jgi:predicted small lipoprotein YifL
VSLRILFFALLPLLIATCGQKGPLELPEKAAAGHPAP